MPMPMHLPKLVPCLSRSKRHKLTCKLPVRLHQMSMDQMATTTPITTRNTTSLGLRLIFMSQEMDQSVKLVTGSLLTGLAACNMMVECTPILDKREEVIQLFSIWAVITLLSALILPFLASKLEPRLISNAHPSTHMVVLSPSHSLRVVFHSHFTLMWSMRLKFSTATRIQSSGQSPQNQRKLACKDIVK